MNAPARSLPERARYTALLAALVCLGAGCTGSVAKSPSFVETRETLLAKSPNAWVAGNGEQSAEAEQGDPAASLPDQWWKDFGDATLDALVEEALANNNDLQAAAARVAMAEAEARISGADLYPSLRLGGDAARSRQVFVGLPIPETDGSSAPLSTTYTQYGVSVDLSWEIDLWGRLRSADAAARAEAEAAGILYDGARLSLAGQTAKTWFALCEAAAQSNLAETTLVSYRSAAEQIRARYERGTRSPLDLRLALAQVAGAEARVADRRSRHERTARQFEVLLGRYPDAEMVEQTCGDSAVASSSSAAGVPVGVPAQLLGRRPDLAAAAYKIYAADQRRYSAKAAMLPRIALTGRAGTISDDVSDLLDGDFGVWTIASNLVQPIFEGGRLRAGVAKAGSAADEAKADYATTALRAFAEVEGALADEHNVSAIVSALGEASVQSDAAERLARQRYRTGLEAYVTVLAAERSALDAKSTLLDARRRRLENRVDLYLALGGGFRDEKLSPLPPGEPGQSGRTDRPEKDPAAQALAPATAPAAVLVPSQDAAGATASDPSENPS